MIHTQTFRPDPTAFNAQSGAGNDVAYQDVGGVSVFTQDHESGSGLRWMPRLWEHAIYEAVAPDAIILSVEIDFGISAMSKYAADGWVAKIKATDPLTLTYDDRYNTGYPTGGFSANQYKPKIITGGGAIPFADDDDLGSKLQVHMGGPEGGTYWNARYPTAASMQQTQYNNPGFDQSDAFGVSSSGLDTVSGPRGDIGEGYAISDFRIAVQWDDRISPSGPRLGIGLEIGL